MGFGEGRVVYSGVFFLSNGAELSIGHRRNEPPNAVFMSFRVKSHKKITDPL